MTKNSPSLTLAPIPGKSQPVNAVSRVIPVEHDGTCRTALYIPTADSPDLMTHLLEVLIQGGLMLRLEVCTYEIVGKSAMS